MNNKFWGMLSLAMRAGRVQVGEGRAEDTIRSGKARLIILSEDASQNTEKKFSDMGSFRDIPIIKIADRFVLGNAIGRDFAVIMAISDNNFADNLLKLYNE